MTNTNGHTIRTAIRKNNPMKQNFRYIFAALLLGGIFVSWSNLHKGTVSRKPSSYFTGKEKEINLGPLDLLSMQQAASYAVGALLPKGCPATLIQKKFIVTAAHCISNNKTAEWLPLNDLSFAVVINEELTRHSIIARNTVTEQPPSNWAYFFESHEADLAILELSEPIEGLPSVQLSFMDQKNLPGKNLVSVGFPVVDGEQAVLIDPYCEIKSVFHNFVMNTNCGADHGNSGGPLFLREQDKSLKMVGITIGIKSNHPTSERINYSDDVASYGLFWPTGSESAKKIQKIFP